MPLPPLIWVPTNEMPDLIEDTELDHILGMHVSTWLHWYRCNSDGKKDASELVRAWKRKRLPVPGGALWAHISDKGKPTYNIELSPKPSPNITGRLFEHSGELHLAMPFID